MNDIRWELLPFEALDPYKLYQLLRLRSLVFVVEQNCVFLDLDNNDQQSIHLLGWLGEELIAYSRLVPQGVIYPYVSIGRVVSHPEHRGNGTGKKLLQEAIVQIEQLWGVQTIKIGAQLYLKKFYESFGFLQQGAVYDEDGIDHIHMLRER